MRFEKDKYYQSRDGQIVVQALQNSKRGSDASMDCIMVKVKKQITRK